jgi:hypothetical protein
MLIYIYIYYNPTPVRTPRMYPVVAHAPCDLCVMLFAVTVYRAVCCSAFALSPFPPPLPPPPFPLSLSTSPSPFVVPLRSRSLLFCGCLFRPSPAPLVSRLFVTSPSPCLPSFLAVNCYAPGILHPVISKTTPFVSKTMHSHVPCCSGHVVSFAVGDDDCFMLYVPLVITLEKRAAWC